MTVGARQAGSGALEVRTSPGQFVLVQPHAGWPCSRATDTFSQAPRDLQPTHGQGTVLGMALVVPPLLPSLSTCPRRGHGVGSVTARCTKHLQVPGRAASPGSWASQAGPRDGVLPGGAAQEHTQALGEASAGCLLRIRNAAATPPSTSPSEDRRGWSRQKGCLPTAGLLLLRGGCGPSLSPPQHPALPGCPDAAKLSDAGAAACSSAQRQAKPARGGTLQGHALVRSELGASRRRCSRGGSGEGFDTALAEGFGARSGRRHPRRKITESRAGCSGQLPASITGPEAAAERPRWWLGKSNRRRAGPGKAERPRGVWGGGSIVPSRGTAAGTQRGPGSCRTSPSAQHRLVSQGSKGITPT